MKHKKMVKDIMVDVFEYPHIPYWFTIKQAIGVIKKSLMGPEKCYHPLAILIFDEKYNLMGTVTLRDILKGLEPKLLRPEIMTEFEGADIEEALTTYEATMFNEEAKKQAEMPVSEIMIPAKTFVSPTDSVAKAAFMMVHHNTSILPVLEDGKKLVGLAKMFEVFDEISSTILE